MIFPKNQLEIKMSVIEITDVTKKYGNLMAVDSLSFHVEKGEVFGFLGPNGAGKTTTIKTMLGLLKPTAGNVYIQGKNVHKQQRTATVNVGYLPEQIQLYENLTGRETLNFFREMRGASNDEVPELLKRVDLLDAADRKVGGYSQGMAQRIAIAQSLLGSPSILVWDEPAAGLDPRGVALVKEIVKNYVKEGGTVFFSSHILPNVQEVADRVAILVNGHLRALDSVQNLREKIKPPAKLHLELSENFSRVEDALKASKKVKEYSGQNNRVTITCENAEKRAVMDLVEQEGVEIIDFSTETKDLEDIFLTYVDEKSEGGQNE